MPASSRPASTRRRKCEDKTGFRGSDDCEPIGNFVRAHLQVGSADGSFKEEENGMSKKLDWSKAKPLRGYVETVDGSNKPVPSVYLNQRKALRENNRTYRDGCFWIGDKMIRKYFPGEQVDTGLVFSAKKGRFEVWKDCQLIGHISWKVGQAALKEWASKLTGMQFGPRIQKPKGPATTPRINIKRVRDEFLKTGTIPPEFENHPQVKQVLGEWERQRLRFLYP